MCYYPSVVFDVSVSLRRKLPTRTCTAGLSPSRAAANFKFVFLAMAPVGCYCRAGL